jgi:hypothetical protein
MSYDRKWAGGLSVNVSFMSVTPHDRAAPRTIRPWISSTSSCGPLDNRASRYSSGCATISQPSGLRSSTLNATTFIAMIQKAYFPYFAEDKNVSVDAIELYNVTAGPTILSVVLSDVMNALAAGAAQLVLDKVPNDPTAQVFMVVRYSIS